MKRYEDNRFVIVGVRKMRWDQKWHILYRLKGNKELDWDRVSKEEALEVAERL